MTLIRALSLHQPFASYVADGGKPIETRMYATKIRGPILCCASKSPKVGALPRGVALACVHIHDCRPMTPEDEPKARCRWEEGRWAWLLDESRRVRLDEPIPVKGKQGFFFVDLPHDLWLRCVDTGFVAYTIGRRKWYNNYFGLHMVQKAGSRTPGKGGWVWRRAKDALSYLDRAPDRDDFSVYKVFLPAPWHEAVDPAIGECDGQLLEDAVVVPGEVRP